MKLFSRAVALVDGKSPRSRGNVEEALQDCERRTLEAGGELDRLATRRPDLLVGGSDADLDNHDTEVRRITLERDRAAAIAVRLREQLDVVIAEENAAKKLQQRSDVEMQSEIAAKALRSRYPKVVAEVHSLLRTIASAQQAIAAFKKVYPDEAPIADPEAKARTLAPIADEVVSEREVWRWRYLNGNPLPDMVYPGVSLAGKHRGHPDMSIIEQIEGGHYRGSLDGPFEHRGDAVRLVRETRREIARQEKARVQDSLAASLDLPGLLPADHGWKKADYWADHARVLSTLDALAVPIENKRRTVVEYLPIAATTR